MLLPLRPEANSPYRALVMLIGGGGTPPVDMRTDAIRSCEILDLGTANPAWTLAAQMANPRVKPDAGDRSAADRAALGRHRDHRRLRTHRDGDPL